jgi:uncharacterized protein YhfF
MTRSITTPLPDPDHVAVAEFWRSVTEKGLAPVGSPTPQADYFGDSVELADDLLALIIDGPKRATASSYDELVREGEPIPQVGDLWITLDGRGVPRALLRTTDVRIGPLSSVDDAFAWDEGEGDRTRDDWLAEHTRFFSRWLPQVGLEFHPDMATVFERFELVHSE